jgi:HAMP domain-containing protein
VAGSGYDLAAEKFFDFREILPERLPQNHPLACVHGTDHSVSGIIDTGRGPMLVAAQPITTSQNLGPVRGTMIMGLFFNREKIAQLQEQVVINFGATPIRKDSISQNDQETLAQLEKRGEDFLVRELSETRLSAYSIFPDIKGNPLLLLKADLPREIFSQGRQTIRNSLLSTFLAGFLIILLLALVVRQQVGIPIKRLADHILTVRETGELEPVRLDNRHDEIGLLAEEFNSLLAELDNRNRAQKKNEAERERVIAELQEALLKIKTLTGLLPICASCKKIRDDKGYWNQIETYIREHSDVEFSHGICPDCYEKQMKELDRIFA